MSSQKTHKIELIPHDSQRLAKLCGQFDEHLRQLEKRFDVHIKNRANIFYIEGAEQSVDEASLLLDTLYAETTGSHEITPEHVHLLIQENSMSDTIKEQEEFSVHTKKGALKARNDNQRKYLKNIQCHDVSFGVGPAGTGKTYLAVAMAIDALEKEEVSRIVLVRPVVEAGENLGFLPGDLTQKIDPYLRPLYDALGDMLGSERVAKMLERGIIEIAPLAYMRGRTLNDCFIILDESQNCTKEQMKMFLTRIGFGTKAVITGDITQVDLPRQKLSGLRHAINVLGNIKQISFNYFTGKDVVRHPLITEIVEAYEDFYHRENQHDSDA